MLELLQLDWNLDSTKSMEIQKNISSGCRRVGLDLIWESRRKMRAGVLRRQKRNKLIAK